MRNAGRSFGKWFQANRQALVWVLISFATLLAAWQLASVFSAGRVQVPAPLEVFRAFFNAMVVPIGRNTILEHAGISLWRCCWAFRWRRPSAWPSASPWACRRRPGP